MSHRISKPKFKETNAVAGSSKAAADPPRPDPDERDVHNLILDYLSHNLFLSTARALSLSSTASPSAAPSAPRPAPTKAFDPNGEDLEEEFERDEDAEMMSSSTVLDPHAEPGQTTSTDGGDAEMRDLSSPPPLATAHDAAEAGGLGRKFPLEGLSYEALKDIEHRKEIKHHVVNGNIQQVMLLLKTHYPTFLASAAGSADAPPPSAPALAAPVPSSTPKHPLVSSNTSSSASVSPSTTPRTAPLAASTSQHPETVNSLQPTHLSLNLLIQSFIETLRSVPLPLSPPSPSPGSPLQSHSPSPASSTHSLASSTTSNLSTRTTTALSLAQQLYARVERLEAQAERAYYRQEIVHVASLMAYVPPETAPMKSFLEQSRRDALADQLNAALLLHTSRPPQSLIESLARQTTFVWERLAQANIDTVPPWASSSSTSSTSSSSSTLAFDDDGNVVAGGTDGQEWASLARFLADHRSFNLAEFLAPREGERAL